METLIILTRIFGIAFAFAAALYVIGAVMSRFTGKRWL